MIVALLAASAVVPMCAPARISLTTGGQPGDFNGMSHSGTMLVLRNRGSRACRLPGLPPVTFRDARGVELPIRRQSPPGMHPGPVIVPLTLRRGAEASVVLRWVSGDVYDHSRCYDAASVAVTIGGRALRTPLTAHVCGPASGATFEQPVLTSGRSD